MMSEYDVIEVKPEEVKLIAEKKRILLTQIGDKWVVVFRDKIRKFRNLLEEGSTFYVSVAKMETFRWEYVGVHPVPEPEVWKVTAVHREKFTPVPHRILKEVLEETLKELGVKDPVIIYANRRWRFFIAWKDGHSGIAIAHKNTAEKGIWVYPYIGNHFVPVGEMERVYHTGNIEDLLQRVKEAIVKVFQRYKQGNIDEAWKRANEIQYTNIALNIVLAKLMSVSPQYVKNYIKQLFKYKKIDGRTVINTLLSLIDEQLKRDKPNITVLEAAWETLGLILTEAYRQSTR